MSSQPQPQEPAEQANPSQPAAAQQADEEKSGYAPLVDPRLPTRKDTSLKDFLAKIDDYAPIVSVYPRLPAHLCVLSLPRHRQADKMANKCSTTNDRSQTA